MTKEDALEKVRKILNHNNEVMLQRAYRALCSGAVDLESLTESSWIPKAIATAVLEDAAEQFSPPVGKKAFRKEVKNLRCFF